jgi:hypothetical protein
MVESGIGGARTSPVAPPAALAAEPGRVVGLVGPPGLGLTRLGLALLAGHVGTVACVDVRGWLSPPAAWEVGLTPDRLVVVRCPDRSRWPGVTAALLEGVGAVYAEVPEGTAEPVLRRLGALVRARRSALLLRPVRGGLPAGVAHLRLQGRAVAWSGSAGGHGRLERRLLTLQAGGRGTGGVERRVEVEDDGTDAVRVVPGLAVAPSRRAAG